MAYGLVDLAQDYLLAFGVLSIGSQLITRAFIPWLRQGKAAEEREKEIEKHPSEPPAQWCFVHALANVFITWASAYDVVNVFADPERALFRSRDDPEINYRVAAMIGAVHAFHALFYRLSPADIFHHLAFVIFNQVAIFWPAFPSVTGWTALQWGSAINMLNFFVCGLPGGCDYFLLGLVKEGRLSYLKHKRHQAMLNVWIRCPGMLTSVAIILFEAMRQWEHTPLGGKVIPILAFVLLGYNALHYMEQVVASAGKKVEDFRGTS